MIVDVSENSSEHPHAAKAASSLFKFLVQFI